MAMVGGAAMGMAALMILWMNQQIVAAFQKTKVILILSDLRSKKLDFIGF